MNSSKHPTEVPFVVPISCSNDQFSIITKLNNERGNGNFGRKFLCLINLDSLVYCNVHAVFKKSLALGFLSYKMKVLSSHLNE